MAFLCAETKLIPRIIANLMLAMCFALWCLLCSFSFCFCASVSFIVREMYILLLYIIIFLLPWQGAMELGFHKNHLAGLFHIRHIYRWLHGAWFIAYHMYTADIF